MTVDEPSDEDLATALEKARSRSLPVVYGESVTEDAGYHSFPLQEAVAHWLRRIGFAAVQQRRGDLGTTTIALSGPGDAVRRRSTTTASPPLRRTAL